MAVLVQAQQCREGGQVRGSAGDRNCGGLRAVGALQGGDRSFRLMCCFLRSFSYVYVIITSVRTGRYFWFSDLRS